MSQPENDVVSKFKAIKTLVKLLRENGVTSFESEGLKISFGRTPERMATQESLPLILESCPEKKATEVAGPSVSTTAQPNMEMWSA